MQGRGTSSHGTTYRKPQAMSPNMQTPGGRQLSTSPRHVPSGSGPTGEASSRGGTVPIRNGLSTLARMWSRHSKFPLTAPPKSYIDINRYIQPRNLPHVWTIIHTPPCRICWASSFRAHTVPSNLASERHRKIPPGSETSQQAAIIRRFDHRTASVRMVDTYWITPAGR